MSVNKDQPSDKATVSQTFLGTDQPETCRNCGARTDFDELADEKQLHQCITCGMQYLLEFDS